MYLDESADQSSEAMSQAGGDGTAMSLSSDSSVDSDLPDAETDSDS